MHYKDCVQKQYQSLRELGMNVDVIAMEHELDDYKVLAAPMAYLMKDGYEDRLRKYVEAGGTLVMTYWSGMVDETDKCFLGGTPHDLMDVCGIRTEEIDALYDWEENFAIPDQDNHLGIRNSYKCKNLCELVRVSDAEVLMRYGEDFYQEYPVLTHHAYGKGHVYYVCADMELDFYRDFYTRITKEAGVKPILESVPEGVSVTVRENETAEYIFIQNYAREAQTIAIPNGYEVLYGSQDKIFQRLQTKVWKKIKAI